MSPYMIKPNGDEIREYTNGSDNIRDALKRLAVMGVEIPLVTLGKDGAMAYINGTYYRYETPVVEVKNTVGSGDSTVAGIAVGLSRGMEPQDAIRLGMSAGTVNALFEQTGMVTKELVNQYFNKIGMEVI